MALNTQRFFTKLFRRLQVSINNTAEPGVTVVSNFGTDPSRVFSLALLGDTSDRTVEVYHHDGTNYQLIWVGRVVANAGRAINNPAIDLVREDRLTGLDRDGDRFFFDLPNGHSIKIRTTTAPTTSVVALVLVRDFAA